MEALLALLAVSKVLIGRPILAHRVRTTCVIFFQNTGTWPYYNEFRTSS